MDTSAANLPPRGAAILIAGTNRRPGNSSGRTAVNWIEMAPFVSVIVPTYDRMRFLVQTIESILNQTYTRIEVLVVADGHQAEVEAYVRQRGDPRLRYIAAPHAGRPAAARNVGIRQSVGDYVAFCDDDDLWLPDKLAKQIDYMTRNRIGFTCTGCDFIDASGNWTGARGVSLPHKIAATTFLTSLGGIIFTPTVVIARDLLDKVGLFDESPALRTGEDYEFYSRLLMHGHACAIREALVHVRIHDSIQPRKLSRWIIEQKAIQAAILRNGSASRLVWLLRFGRMWYWSGRVLLRNPLAPTL